MKTVAMESTSNCWITLYDTTSAAGSDVFLVNARRRGQVHYRQAMD